jgi:phage terminase large subunit
MQKIILKDYPNGWHNKKFLPLLKDEERYLLMIGGAGSGKSRFAGLKILDRTINEPVNHRLLLVRKVHRDIRRSSLQLILDYIKVWKATSLFAIRESDMSIEYLPNGNQIISSGLDDPERLKSIERITGTWIEESTELTYDDFVQVDLRLRGELGTYQQHLMTFNPINAQSWVNKSFFEAKRERCTIHHSTVDDNEFIDTDYIGTLNALRNEDRNKYNIYRLGLWGVLEELIYMNYEFITEDEWPGYFDETIYGLDFGFNNPSALLQVIFKDDQVYERELLYKTKLTNQQLIAEMETLIPNKSDYIYADSAEPARIEEISKAGFNVYPAEKDVIDGIDYCKRIHSFIHEDSINYKKELNHYSYKKDKNGNVLEEPIKFLDHLCDCRRYAHFTYRHKAEPFKFHVGIGDER